MEMIIKCPDCGKNMKVTIEEVKKKPDTVTLTQKVESFSTWVEIAEEIKSCSGEILVGDEISCALKDGTKVTFVVAHINPYGENEAVLVLKDCLPDRHVMNEECTNKGGWRDSDMRTYLKDKIYPLLPDDLKEHIRTRIIVQNHRGEELRSEDDIWLLSRTEVFGGNNSVDVGDVHFDLFNDEKSRVKQIDGETAWYSLRSPWSSNTTNFALVYNNGSEYNNFASNSIGVSFGFLFA